MSGRVLLGKATTERGGSSVFGLWVSKPNANVETCDEEDLLFDSTKPRHGQILKSGVASATGAGGGTNSTIQVTVPASTNVMVYLGGNTNFNKAVSLMTVAQTISTNTMTLTFSTSSSTGIATPYIITSLEAS